MRYFFILNPGSKGGKSGKKFNKIFQLLDKNKIDYEFKATNSLEDAYDYSVYANKKGYDIVVAVGGDGTINRVLNGFYDDEGKRISNAKFAVIYTGTSPDFCKSYNIPIQLDKAVDTLLKNKSRRITIGRIVHHISYDETLDKKALNINDPKIIVSYFACCANVGVGPHIARSANSGIRKYIGDFFGTFISLIKTIIQYKPNDFTINFDGKIQTLKKVFSLSIGRTTYIASGIKVKNDLSFDDNSFYNLLVKNMGLLNLVGVFRKIYSGEQFENDSIISLQYAEHIEIYGNSQNSEIEFDGDPRGFLPCTIESAQDTLDLICEGHHE